MSDSFADRYAKELAAFEDERVNELLDRHGLKGKSRQELHLLGYRLHQDGGDIPSRHTTWVLWKYVDSISYLTELKISPVYINGPLEHPAPSLDSPKATPDNDDEDTTEVTPDEN